MKEEKFTFQEINNGFDGTWYKFHDTYVAIQFFFSLRMWNIGFGPLINRRKMITPTNIDTETLLNDGLIWKRMRTIAAIIDDWLTRNSMYDNLHISGDKDGTKNCKKTRVYFRILSSILGKKYNLEIKVNEHVYILITRKHPFEEKMKLDRSYSTVS